MTTGPRGQSYELVVRGELGDRFGLLFEGMRLERVRGDTVLTGPVLDQAHLHGVIERIQELGVELVSVNATQRGPQMSAPSTTPDTIVLIHGFWVTPRSWEHWVAHYEAKGFRVLAPAYPGFEVEVEALNADPTPIEKVTVPEIIEHLESVVGAVDSPPILIGHSAGGVFTQILLDHGFGAAGVAINSAPTEGVKRVPLSQVKATFPVLKNPANRHRAVGFTFEQWHYAFTNTFSEEESRALYERYHIPASGQIFWGSALANVHPGKDDNHVNYKNDDRAPLLFISGERGPPDAAVDPAVQRQALQVRHDHRGQGVRRARTCCRPRPAGRRSPTTRCRGRSTTPPSAAPRDRRPPHPHRRADRAHRGGRVAPADRPDVRRPRPEVPLRLGGGVAQARRAGDRRRRPGAHRRGAALRTTTTTTTSTRRAARCFPSAGVVVTTVSGAGRLGGSARGLAPWDATRLEAPGRPAIEITATPCRHGPPHAHFIVGDVIGFALRWEGLEHGALWISGDTVLYDGVREVADRIEVDTALLHLGGVRFPVTGPVRYTMTARDAVELCRLSSLAP